MILRLKSLNQSCRFWGPNWEICQPWFWGSIKKLTLLVSMCTVQTAHGITRPPDRPATKYSNCVWPSPVLCNRSPTPATILISTRYVAPTRCTLRDMQTWFSTRNKNKGKTTGMSRIRIQTSACKWLITYQTKVLHFVSQIAWQNIYETF
jgi:hypothetical protein